jgi:hypothetical protein
MFHHWEKTGGTTFRTMLAVQRELGDFGARWMFMQDKCARGRLMLQHWPADASAVLCGKTGRYCRGPAKEESCASSRLPPLDRLRVAIEFHSGIEHVRIPALLEQVPLLRAHYRAAGCTFALVTILREPRAQLYSWHNHFGRGRKESLERSAAREGEFVTRPLTGLERDQLYDTDGGCAPAVLARVRAALGHFDVVGVRSIA